MTLHDMDGLIRASSMTGYAGLVRSLGGDPDALRAAAGVRPDVAEDVESYVPYRTVTRLFAQTAAVLDCPDFGLRLSEYQGIEILGAVAVIARHAPTGADAIADIQRYLHLYSPAFTVSLQALSSDVTRFSFVILVPNLPDQTQILELSLAVSLGLLRVLLGANFTALCAHLPHAAVSPPARYRQVFGCPARFDAESCSLDLVTAELLRPRSGNDPAVRELATRYLEDATATADPAEAPYGAEVRRILLRLLPTGHAAIASVAAHLGVHERTLQRALAEEHTTFARLLDDVRREQAERFLRESSRPLGQIAMMLGFSQQSCLTRACRRWFGSPPSQLRAQAGLDHAGR